jgi:hypothetical protein
MQFGLLTLISLIVVIIIAVLITQVIWNNVMPDAFGLKQLDFWHTLGLLILANIFFGSHCNATNVSYY